MEQASIARPSSPPINMRSQYRDEDDSRPVTPNIKITPDPSTPRTYDDRPVSADVLSSLVANPWTQTNEPEISTPPFNRHTSTPVLPSEAAAPPLASRSDPELPLPRTPTRGKSHSGLPTTPGTAGSQLRRLRTGERVGSLARNSIAGPLLASPLSTSLSTMVQDLKRGGNIRHKDADGSVRRRESILGIGASEVDAPPLGEALSRRQTRESALNESVGAVTPGGRTRSLSGTLNELWRGLRGQSSRENLDAQDASPRTGGGDTER
ncbi:hypothetical protein N0V83_007673 [Neocucurbitaria cava]|uniref:Uncharacterized protein n=1 Tax=Neocucurbitaria cava TaxID=798079 RepID=A0A9W8Y4A4_9PLEO|nr:hypothetical protein N0V83_007673 [Neocucurbitaria cava]